MLKEFTRGWLNGFFGGHGIQEVQECLNHQDIFDHLFNALEEFRKCTLDGFTIAAQEIKTITDPMEKAVHHCVKDEFQKSMMIKKFETLRIILPDLTSMGKLIVNNFLLNGKDILLYISEATISYINSDYYISGEFLGLADKLLLFSTSANTFDIPAQEPKPMEAFLKGMFIEMFKEAAAGEMVECMDSTGIFKDFYSAYEQFEKFNVGGFVSGVSILASAFTSLPRSLEPCLQKYDDQADLVAQKLKYAQKLVYNPVKLHRIVMNNAITNARQIIQYMQDSISSFQNSDWQNAGLFFGQALDLTIFFEMDKDFLNYDQLEKKLQKVLQENQNIDIDSINILALLELLESIDL